MRMPIVIAFLLLAACTAPSTQGEAGARRDGVANEVAQAQPVPAGKPQAGRRVKMPPLGGPLPPERVQGYCDADADCGMRAGRNGCATCSSRSDAASHAPAVARDCSPQQTECRCVDHRCQSRPLLIDSPVEQAAPEDDTP